MAKQRRSRSRPPARKNTTPARSTKIGRATKSAGARPGVASPAKRTTYLEAVAVYQQGLQALQRHDYGAAARLFNSVLDQYPEEKELHERVRLYLKVCERQLGPVDATPKTVEERVYAATVAINKGAYDEAIRQLERVESDDPSNDHAQYMLAVAHTLKGKLGQAFPHLERAVGLNPENRALARRDQDLAALWEDEACRAVLQAPASPRRDRRMPARARSGTR